MPRSVQIIPYYSQPHVHTYINDNSFYPEDTTEIGDINTKPYDTLLITGADKGIDNKFVKLTDYGTKVELFGKGNYKKYGQSSIQADALLNSNQTNLWFMRVLPDDAVYANLAVIAHYRVAKCITDPTYVYSTQAEEENDCPIKVLRGDATNPILEPTGLKQLEVKFSTVNLDRYGSSSVLNSSAPLNDSDIESFLTGKSQPAGSSSYVYNMFRGSEYTVAQANVFRDYNGKQRTPDELLGFYSVPLFYVRAVGRGKYGNKYGLRIQREVDFEYDHDIKAYGFGLVERDLVSAVKKYFVGSMVTSTRYDSSTVIDDIIDAYTTGSAPIFIKTYEESIQEIFEHYRKTVKYNKAIIAEKYPNDEDWNEYLEYAEDLIVTTDDLGNFDNLDQFDPVFGYRLNSTTNLIPFYANFTVKSTPYVEPALTISNYLPAELTSSHLQWNNFVDTTGETLIRVVDERIKIINYIGVDGTLPTVTDTNYLPDKVFKITDILAYREDPSDPAKITKVEVTYDEGTWVDWNESEYNGVNLGLDIGQALSGGWDGEFEEILAKPKTGYTWDTTGADVYRAPTDSEMKLLLSREYVKAIHGEKDKYILSPARINLDFIFDANYNICIDLDSTLISGGEKKFRALFANSHLLTTDEYNQLMVLDTGYQFSSNLETSSVSSIYDLLNVKKALYDLNNYRNKNGMVLSSEEGAGCELKLDCGLVALSKTSESSTELKELLNIMGQFEGRNVSIDFGHYQIIDPTTKRKVNVSATYHLAENLIPHIVRYGPNKPFVNNYAQIENKVKNSFRPELDIIDWEVKELLYKNRINYYITLDEGAVVQRCVQNTCQKDASSLLEETNVRVLNILKKGLEKACRSYLYEWNDPIVRKGYTDTQMEVYKPWIGTWVEDLNIYFDANDYEQERMIMHCYVDVKFRDIIKRITIEIDISRPNSSSSTSST